ncbi:methylated-DNA--[protein]-cysteine S-methyltransferase [Bradyrhizobium sp. 2TAF24]|uniref:methylated-DNA--[protein]-cysteine S-methyltransferase n=1 Tax=Bradyrhizobium sp. 2TAF24 TaxID=3233011 RepID=UPI003F91C88D
MDKFMDQFRMRPSPDPVLTYATGACALGAVLVAASGNGIRALLLGDSTDTLVRDLRTRFPHAELVASTNGCGGRLADVIRLIETPDHAVALPLDPRGTAFQRRVWQALRAIPAGETRSYGEVARAIGTPGAVRSVASACAANPIAVAIPCHRVVRADGTLSGYRWGVARKTQLLQQEAAR